MAQSFTPWRVGADYPAATEAAYRGPEWTGADPFFRDSLDRTRSGFRATPEAQYPDGYLMPFKARRDRIYDGLKVGREQSKPYDRGVHHGERIDPSDYIWPEEFNLMSGLVNESKGLRWAPPGIGQDMYQNRAPNSSRILASMDMDQKQRLLPAWSGPGMGIPYPGGSYTQ
jgi:hypothetical protein